MLTNRDLVAPTDAEHPNTTDDMDNLFKWKLGDDDPVGTHAKEHIGMKNYIDDMRNPPDYSKDFYVNTLSEKKSIGQQLLKR